MACNTTCCTWWALCVLHVICTWWALCVLHVICTRVRSGHLGVHVGDGSRRSEEIVKNLALRLWMRLLLLLHTAALRQKLQIKPATSLSHSILTPGQPILLLALEHQAPDRVSARVRICKSLVWFVWGKWGWKSLFVDLVCWTRCPAACSVVGWVFL